MALPTFRSSATNTGDAVAAANISCNMPTGTIAGDVMVAHMVANGAAAVWDAPPSGWAVVEALATSGTGGAAGTLLAYKIAASGETGPYTFSVSGVTSPSLAIGIASYSGPNGTPLDAHGSTNDANAQGGTYTAPDVTTTQADCIVIRAFQGGNFAMSYTDSALGARERFQIGAGTSVRKIALADEDKAAAGATGTQTVTVTGTPGHTGDTAAFTGAAAAPTETLRPNATLTLSNFTGAFTDIDADPDTTPVVDAGLVPVVDP